MRLIRCERNEGRCDVSLKRYVFNLITVICLFGLMACAHSGKAPIEEEAKEALAGTEIEFDYADSASLAVVRGVEKDVLTLKNFQVGAGRNRMLIIGVQAEERGKENASDMGVSSVTYGGHALTLVPNSEVQLSSIWVKDNTEYFLKVALYYLLNPPSGKHDITVTFAGPVTSGNVGGISLFNTQQAAPENVVTNQKSNPSGKKEIITRITTKNNGAWVADFLGCGKRKSRLQNLTKDYTQRFEAMESTGGRSTLAGGTMFVPVAGEITLHWVQRRWTINRLAHVAVEIAPGK
jgi:hypothetical protein